jgi:hypothetical protein
MALIGQQTETFGGDACRITWSSVKAGDTCEPSFWSRHADRSVQVSGVFGGATVEIHGSNDGVNFDPLTDLRGNNITFLSRKLEQVEDCSYAIKPVIVGGDGTTDLLITMFARKS